MARLASVERSQLGVNNFALDFFKKLLYIIPMMNDMMPTIEETATPDILAQIEHEEWQRGQEERERAEERRAQPRPEAIAKAAVQVRTAVGLRHISEARSRVAPHESRRCDAEQCKQLTHKANRRVHVHAHTRCGK